MDVGVMKSRLQIVIAGRAGENDPAASSRLTRFGRFKRLLAGLALAAIIITLLIVAVILGYIIAAVLCAVIVIALAVLLVKSTFHRTRQ